MKINDLVKQANTWSNSNESFLFDSKGKQLKVFEAIVIQPHEDIDIGNGLVANDKLIKLRVQHGLDMAKAAFKNITNG